MRRIPDNPAWKWLAFRMMLVSALVAPGVAYGRQEMVEPSTDACASWHLNQSATVGQYVFKAFKSKETGGACLEVETGSAPVGKVKGLGRLALRLPGRLVDKDTGEVIFRRAVDSFGVYTLGQPAKPESNIPEIENGTDITGLGRPDMIVTNWTGGAHCCFVHYIFELAPKLRLVARLDDGEGDGAHFAQLDGQGRYYYFGHDWTFAYWNASFADSHAPAVILLFAESGQGDGYHLAMEKMRRPVPTQAEWNRAVKEASGAIAVNDPTGNGIGSGLWSNMVNLIYTGHSELAWKLYDQAWPPAKAGKENFLGGFCSQLKTSPYWGDLQETMQSAPPACANAKPERAGE